MLTLITVLPYGILGKHLGKQVTLSIIVTSNIIFLTTKLYI